MFMDKTAWAAKDRGSRLLNIGHPTAQKHGNEAVKI
jgi:hypothetical protein